MLKIKDDTYNLYLSTNQIFSGEPTINFVLVIFCQDPEYSIFIKIIIFKNQAKEIVTICIVLETSNNSRRQDKIFEP